MSWRDCPDPIPGDAESVDAVEAMIVPRAVDLGEMIVRRALPATERQMVGPFIFVDQMGPAEFLTDQGIDVRPHPHINLATVTYLLEGELLHRDRLGTEQAIRPGAINWMLAGRGIVHSERTAPKLRESGQRLFGMQTWVALPEAMEECDPVFVHHPSGDLPLVADGPVTIRLIAGTTHGLSSPLMTASPTLYADIAMRPGARFEIETTYEERVVYILSGQIAIDGVVCGPGRLIVFRSGAPIALEAVDPARVMLYGGEPMEGPRYIWWNFVSSRPERIATAQEEWRTGRFDTVPGDAEDFIPLPDTDEAPRQATGGRAFGPDAEWEIEQ
ncbi:MAG: pirin family protein [Pseudomonadota bacterium]